MAYPTILNQLAYKYGVELLRWNGLNRTGLGKIFSVYLKNWLVDDKEAFATGASHDEAESKLIELIKDKTIFFTNRHGVKMRIEMADEQKEWELSLTDDKED